MYTREQIEAMAPRGMMADIYDDEGDLVKRLYLDPEWTRAGVFRLHGWDKPVEEVAGFKGRLTVSLSFPDTKGIESEEAS